jgi:hypothetical protein
MTTACFLSDPISRLLWRDARAWLAAMLADFISPAHVARAFARRARAVFRQRLQMLESLVTKLLLIEAASLRLLPGRRKAASREPMSKSAAAEAARPALQLLPSAFMGPGFGAARRSKSGCQEHPAHSATWRVRFHARIPRRREGAAAAARRARLQPAPEAIRARADARRLARRFEALRRVIADPRAAIIALARKLSALGAAAYAAARRIALWRPRSAAVSIAHGHATVAAHDASQHWRNTS